MTLKQPIAILRRRPAAEVHQSNGSDGSGAMRPEYDVQGHIRSKYIFKSRPKALISQVS